MNSNRVILRAYQHRKKNGKRGQKKVIDLEAKLRVDLKPEWMKNLRVVRELNNVEIDSMSSDASMSRDATYKGFKLMSNNMTGIHGFQYSNGCRTYEHVGEIRLCSSGFHFSFDPLQCLRYAEQHNFEKPYRLFEVTGSGVVDLGSDKLCASILSIENEITSPQKLKELLTGISVTKNSIKCYKNGELHNPAPGVYADYQAISDYHSISCDAVSMQNGKPFGPIVPMTFRWPPDAFLYLSCFE